MTTPTRRCRLLQNAGYRTGRLRPSRSQVRGSRPVVFRERRGTDSAWPAFSRQGTTLVDLVASVSHPGEETHAAVTSGRHRRMPSRELHKTQESSALVGKRGDSCDVRFLDRKVKRRFATIRTSEHVQIADTTRGDLTCWRSGSYRLVPVAHRSCGCLASPDGSRC